MNGNIILDYLVKTIDGLITRVKFLCKRKSKRAHISKEITNDIDDLHTELGHPSEDITWAFVKAVDLQ